MSHGPQLTPSTIVRRSPYVEDDARIESWVVNMPELRTRPELLEYLRSHRSLRKALFNATNALENVALIPCPLVAVEALGIYWQHVKWRFETFWKNRLSEDIGEDHALWAQLYGTLRNVFKNALVKAGSRRAQNFGLHDVRRDYAVSMEKRG